MDKSILVFSNGEKIGDGIIKLPLLYEIKRRMPEKKLVWMTNKGPTVYNNELKNIANQFIDEIIEKANLNPFFWTKISNKYNLKNREFEYILDTQKVVSRTLALKRIKSEHFISSSGSGIFSTIKIMQNKKSNSRRYYLDDLFDLLDLIKKEEINTKFKIEIPKKLENILSNKFKKDHLYLGLAPGAGEKNKIWPLENFIDVGKYFEKKSFTIVLFLGPKEIHLKEELTKIFPNSILPEEEINDFTGPEIAMASTKFLSCALANDSGISHILSTTYCPLIKLFGPKDSEKFTPLKKNITTISSKDFNTNEVSAIPANFVIGKIKNILKIN